MESSSETLSKSRETKQKQKKQHQKEYQLLGLALLIQTGLSFGGSVLIRSLSSIMIEDMYPFLMVLCMLSANLLPFFLFSKLLSLSYQGMFTKKGSISLILVSTVICFLLNYSGSIFAQLINWLIACWGFQFAPSGSMQEYGVAGTVTMTLYTLLIAPVTEELLCRGLLLQTLKKSGYLFAIITSSFLFAMLHGNIEQGIPSFLVGILLSYLALRTSSLLPGMMVHILNNTLVFFLNLLIPVISYTTVHYIILVIATFGLLLLIPILIVERRRMRSLSYYKSPKGSCLWLFTSFSILLNILFYTAVLLSSLQKL